MTNTKYAVLTKKIMVLSLISLLVGCGNSQEKERKIREQYMTLNCDQLNREYDSLSDKKEEEYKARMTMNGVNTVVGVLGIVSGAGIIGYNGKSDGEIEYEKRLEILHEVMSQKQCNVTEPKIMDTLI